MRPAGHRGSGWGGQFEPINDMQASRSKAKAFVGAATVVGMYSKQLFYMMHVDTAAMGGKAMAELVSSTEQIADNIETLYRYGESTNYHERRFHDKRIKNGKCFVVVQVRDGFRYAPSKFAGYVANDINHADKLRERDGRRTNKILSRLLGDPLEPGEEGYNKIDREFLDYCSRKEIEPSQHHRTRRYWVFYESKDHSFPEEVESDDIWEGALESVLVNRFERSRNARDQCLRHYGYACSVCGSTLKDIYGIVADEFIHVHHIVPLSEVREGYQINPINDLRPVCPNCHAVIHRRKKPLTIEEVKELLGQ